jgi:hypothetical protein
MLAVLSTLVSLAVIWLVVAVGAAMLEESGAKIAAALKGRPAQPPAMQSRVRIRVRSRPAMRATPHLRAAA